ncbi:MAG: hypothetical protein KYX68_14235 [Flavobacterium sp.]|nr:hypothetical protein [Flavobacterium sp.]
MKKIFLLFIIVFTLYGCFREEDDSIDNCSSDCTILQGRVVTTNNQGISGINVTLEFFKGASLSSYTRLISDINSNDSGNFIDEFYLKDEEIDENSYGNLILRIDESGLNAREDIITPNSANISLERWFVINNRDTIIEQNYYFPKKTNVLVNLNNFIPLQENDRFEVRPLFPYGYENPEPENYINILETIYIPTNGPLYEATEINNSLNVILAQNEKNIIRIYKTKNGVYTYDEIILDVNSSSPNEITIEY